MVETAIGPGSSLGGARPKATVQAPDGSLWIAKFPSKHDETDSGAWEMVVIIFDGQTLPDFFHQVMYCTFLLSLDLYNNHKYHPGACTFQHDL